MIKVLLKVESRYLVDRKKLRERVVKFLEKKVNRSSEVSIIIVGDRKMRQLNRDYRDLDKTTNVLSFALHETRKGVKGAKSFSLEKSSPDSILRLGDVVVSYPQAVKEAAEKHKMVDDRVYDLTEHGIKHLLGIHHD